jgi:hypothetical protein
VYEGEVQEPLSQGNTQHQQELLTITIDIGNGMQENIQVFEGDNPYDLARDFAHRHSLDLRLTDLLASQIQNNIDQVILQGGAMEQYYDPPYEDNAAEYNNEYGPGTDVGHPAEEEEPYYQ